MGIKLAGFYHKIEYACNFGISEIHMVWGMQKLGLVLENESLLLLDSKLTKNVNKSYLNKK